jgi:hypothetical protein
LSDGRRDQTDQPVCDPFIDGQAMANLPPSTLSPAWSVVAELNPTPCSLAWHLSPAVDPRAGSESRYDGPFPLSSSPKGIGTWPELSGCQAAAISLFCGRVLTEGSWLSSLLPKAAGPSLSGTLESSFRGCCLGVRLQPAPPRRSQWSTAASFAAGSQRVCSVLHCEWHSGRISR